MDTVASFTVNVNRLAQMCAYSTAAPEWEEFVRIITPVVALTAHRVSLVWGDPTQHAVSEITQEVFLKLVEDDRRVLREFKARGNEAFLKLVRVVTASVATDYHRRAQAGKRGGRKTDADAVVEEAPAQAMLPDTTSTDAVEWPALMGQLDDLLHKNTETITARDRQIFWLYYRQGLTAQAIAKIPIFELSAKGVESALRRMAQTLRETIEQGKQDGSGKRLRRLQPNRST